jgi:hypothetical protein
MCHVPDPRSPFAMWEMGSGDLGLGVGVGVDLSRGVAVARKGNKQTREINKPGEALGQSCDQHGPRISEASQLPWSAAGTSRRCSKYSAVQKDHANFVPKFGCACM